MKRGRNRHPHGLWQTPRTNLRKTGTAPWPKFECPSAADCLLRTGAHKNPHGERVFNRSRVCLAQALDIAVDRMVEAVEYAERDLRFQLHLV